jgi:glycosyl transferase, family 25
MIAARPITAIKVISLTSSADRREAFAKQASDNRLDWSFFPACTGLAEPLKYDERAAIRRCGRLLSPSEIGCYASHFKLWEWLATSDCDQAIIFEDDILVDWRTIEQLALNDFAELGIDILRLYITHPFHSKIARYRLFSPHTHLVRPLGMTFGAQGYLLTKRGARELLSNYSVAAAPVDWVLSRYWEHRLPTYCIFPSPLIELAGRSTIGDKRHAVPQRSVADRIARFGWRIRDRAERAYVERCLMKKFPFGPIKDSGPPFLPHKFVRP